MLDGGAVPTALDVVDGEVRELIRRRGLDPFTEPGPVRGAGARRGRRLLRAVADLGAAADRRPGVGGPRRAGPGGRLRPAAALPRRPGGGGDLGPRTETNRGVTRRLRAV